MEEKGQLKSFQMSKKWYSKFLKDVYLSATYEIFNNFKNSKFVVLKQEDHKDFIYREIAFILGPYILCVAKNKTMKNDLVEEWVVKNPHIPFGKIFKNRSMKRKLLEKTKNSRKYAVTGEINALIEEDFQELKSCTVSAFCGDAFNSKRDIEVATAFTSNNSSDIYLFPESYPFSRTNMSTQNFPEGTIFGKYGDNGPETFFVEKKITRITKSTAFANEKDIMKKSRHPKIINYNGLKIAIIICYDLLNPRISHYLSKKDVDMVFIPSMIPQSDVKKWKKFLYVRGQEIQCPLILASNKDKRGICASKVLHYDPIKEEVLEYSKPKSFDIPLGGLKIRESPKVHWSWLLKNEVFGPFSRDFD